jgi:hypothetical protein
MSESSYTQPSIYSGYEKSVQYIPQNTIYTVQPNNPQINCDYCHSIGATYYYFPMCLKYHSFHPNCFSHITSTTPPSFCWKCTTDASKKVMYDNNTPYNNTQYHENGYNTPSYTILTPPNTPEFVPESEATSTITVYTSPVNQDISFITSRVKRIIRISCIFFSVVSVGIFISYYFTQMYRG